jgi:aspartyl-tRNA(Asn)/glutamyl-tRNA(Gln) amidotransferase subunit A
MPTNDPLRAMEHIAYTLPYNMSEQPALSLPWATTRPGCPSGCRSSAAGTTTWVCCAWRAPGELARAAAAWPQPPGSQR